MNDEEKIKELTLLLLYLNSWNEDGYSRDENDNIIETKIKRSFKGYDFDILNALENENLLNGGYKSKTVYLTKSGEDKALELYKKYFGVDYED
ncbi:MAG: DUF6429 family protein [Bacilli bacterium]